MIATLDRPKTSPGIEVVLDHLSPSSVKDYLGCPLRFFFTRILRIEKPVSPSLHLGKAVHAGIEYANRLQFRREKVEVESVMEAFHRAFDDHESEQAVDWRDTDQQTELRACGERVLRAFLESEVFKSQDRPMGVEVQLRCPIDGSETSLLGYVDRVNGDGSPVDYKTVGATPSIEAEVWQHQLQLTAYSELVADATGIAPPGAELVFLVKTKVPKIVRTQVPAPSLHQRQRFWSLVRIVLEGVQAQRFHPQPGMHCSWCPYREECAGWCGNRKGGRV
jgi:putative RecB family exonuclease